MLDKQTDAWGIKVSNVEIKHVDLNETMVRAIARQAEAERERRAKVIHAEGELQASEKLLQAAQMLAQRSEAMQLRYLQTLTQIANDTRFDDRVPRAGGRARRADVPEEALRSVSCRPRARSAAACSITPRGSRVAAQPSVALRVDFFRFGIAA